MSTNVVTKRVVRGDIFYADLTGLATHGSEQSGTRPVIIIQNDNGNKHAPTVIVACITSSPKKGRLPVHQRVDLTVPSVIMCEQLMTISKSRLRNYVGRLSDSQLRDLDNKLRISLAL